MSTTTLFASGYRPRRWLLAALLWVFALGPYAAGEGYASSVGPHVVLVLGFAFVEVLRGAAVGRAWVYVFALGALLLLHYAWAQLVSPCHDLLVKSAGSLVLFLFVVWSLALLAESVDIDVQIATPLLTLLGLVTAAVVIHHLILLSQGRTLFERASGIFPEPSHLALAMAPALVAMVFGGRVLSISLAFVYMGTLLLLSSSSTLVIVLLAAFICVALAAGYGRRVGMLLTRVLLPVVAMLVLVWLSPYRDEALARLAGVQAADVGANASSVIYVMGWEHALENLRSTNWLGLGFNRMGCEPRPVTDTTEIIELMNLGDANYNDGSFTVSKLLSELGLLGIGLWVSCSLVFMVQIKRAASGINHGRRPLLALLVAMVAVLLIGGFVRGTGYFSGPFLAGVFALFLLRRMLAVPQTEGTGAEPAVKSGTEKFGVDRVSMGSPD